MSDVVESGRPERPGRGWAVGGLAVLLVAGAAYGATRPAPERARGRATPTPTSSSSPTPPYGSVPDPTVTPEPGVDGPDGSPPVVYEDPGRGEWALPPRKVPTGLRLAGPGQTFNDFRLDDDDVTSTRLPAFGEVDPVAAIPGGWLAFQRPTCETYRCADSTLYAVHDGGRVEPVAKGEDAVLAEDGRSLWLTGFTSATKGRDENPRWLERRAFDGQHVGPRRTLRAGEVVVGAAGGGLVLTNPDGFLEPVTLLDPVTGGRRVLVERGDAVAVSRSHVAWTSPGCHFEPIEACALHLTHLTTRRTVTLASLPVPVDRAAFDPSARYVAASLDYLFAETPPPQGTAPAVVYDTRTRREVRLRGLRFPPVVGGLAWSPDGWLLLTHEKRNRNGAAVAHSLALWRPGMAGPVAAGQYPGKGHGRFVVRSG